MEKGPARRKVTFLVLGVASFFLNSNALVEPLAVAEAEAAPALEVEPGAQQQGAGPHTRCRLLGRHAALC